MISLDSRIKFPDVTLAQPYGLLAIGGDLSIERLMLAYNSGIFPWYNDGEPICWWSPDPRMVFDLTAAQPMRITKSLRQSKRNKGYVIKENTCFRAVMQHCAQVPRNGEFGTWINDDLVDAYTKLHELGHAKSVEVFLDDTLVGGLYGIDLPHKKIFCGESMFSLATDSSKIALWFLIERLKNSGYTLLDAQIYNEHLDSLGAVTMERTVFMKHLNG
ncbi:MAG: leucyl/phenylalanyl-tRNA--protein transferase [Nonlabens sp.]|nr:leucyl/phenylalanyl-tRNA--protein transferase [Nonlabens sp.]